MCVCACKKKRDLESILDFESLQMDEREGRLMTTAYTVVCLYVCISIMYMCGCQQGKQWGKKELGPPSSSAQTVFFQQMKKEWTCHQCFTVERQARGSNQIQA